MRLIRGASKGGENERIIDPGDELTTSDEGPVTIHQFTVTRSATTTITTRDRHFIFSFHGAVVSTRY